jgi:hypothetical protein
MQKNGNWAYAGELDGATPTEMSEEDLAFVATLARLHPQVKVRDDRHTLLWTATRETDAQMLALLPPLTKERVAA